MFSTIASYGLIARILHWGMALAIIAMFALGLWMRQLDYYSPYYQSAPHIHKSVGIILFVLLLFRLIWRLIDRQPSQDGLNPLNKRLSHIVHWLFYPLLLGLMIAGYFISTADGRSISVFGLFDVPAVINKKGIEATAGLIHYYMAVLIIAFAALHAGAALYHHFITKDGVLTSMLGFGRSNNISIDNEIKE